MYLFRTFSLEMIDSLKYKKKKPPCLNKQAIRTLWSTSKVRLAESRC